MSQQQVINFYSTGDEYGEFSNFAAYPITLQGKRWPTSEHYFQAQKFENLEHQEAIRKTQSPMIAARMGRDRKKKLRRDWESVKVGIMREAVLAKFTQHDELQTLLTSKVMRRSSSTQRTTATGATAAMVQARTCSVAS